MVSNRATLEAQRIEALYRKDGHNYKSLSDVLGYRRSALEDPELYDSVPDAQQNSFSDVERRKPVTVEDLANSELFEVSKILEKFIPRAPKNNSEGDRIIVSRLKKISRVGYPVPDFSNLRGPQVFDLYIQIKDAVLQELRKRKNK